MKIIKIGEVANDMNNGYIKVYRKTLNSPIVMKDADCLAIWLYLLLNATHKEKSAIFKGKKIILKPGQLLTGTIAISKKLKINKDKVQRTLKLYETDKQIEQQTSNKNRLITIVNWELYQESNNQNDNQMINNCETTDKQLITNNNDNNIFTTTTSTRKNETSGRYGNERNGDENLFEFVEKMFGRTINSVEAEHIDRWKDNELTRHAVREAVLANAYSIKYIEKILERYKRENIKSVSEITEKEEKILAEETEILNYDWLNGGR